MSERKETKGGYTLCLERDAEPHDPREDDNIGTMVCFHRNYKLGDYDKHYDLKDEAYFFDQDGKLVEEEADYGTCFTTCGKFKEVSDAQLFASAVEARGGIVLPLFLYDHSGITMSTGAFGCRWDSGQVGFIYVTAKRIKEEYGDDPDAREKAKGYLEGEVKQYDQYLTGDVWGWEIEDECDDSLESCWGYYDQEDAWVEGMISLKHLVLKDERDAAEIAAHEDDRIRSEEDQHLSFISNH